MGHFKREHQQLTTREEIFSDIQGAKYFSNFWEVKLGEESKTCFKGRFGRPLQRHLVYCHF